MPLKTLPLAEFKITYSHLHDGRKLVEIAEEEAGELLITTKNSVYHCPLEYCRFRKQDREPDMIPDYEKII